MHNINILCPPLSVNFQNGNVVLVTHTGSVTLHSLSIVLREVLFIPSFAFNLLSIGKLSSQLESVVYFTSTTCYLQDQAKMKALVLGNMEGGLYQFLNNPVVEQASASVVVVSQKSSQSLWHKRLGHIPSQILLKISDLDMSSSSCT